MAISTIPVDKNYTNDFVSTTGDSFGKNFLTVAPDSPNSIVRARAAFYWDASTKTDFSNIPTALNSVTGAVIGMREVFYRTNVHILVRVTEFYPSPGRQHFNLYNNGSWSGWKTLTPT